MPAMITGLKARGFRFMTVSELLSYGGENEPEPGQIYTQLKSPKSSGSGSDTFTSDAFVHPENACSEIIARNP